MSSPLTPSAPRISPAGCAAPAPSTRTSRHKKFAGVDIKRLVGRAQVSAITQIRLGRVVCGTTIPKGAEMAQIKARYEYSCAKCGGSVTKKTVGRGCKNQNRLHCWPGRRSFRKLGSTRASDKFLWYPAR